MQQQELIISKKYVLLLAVITASCRQQLLFEQKKEAATGIGFINSVVETDSLNLLTYPYFYNGAGVAVGDINNDGWDDIFFVSNKKQGNKLYLNKQGFIFEDITATAGLQGKSDWSTGATMVDINADGWLDIYISTVSIAGSLTSTNELYINNRNGTFTESATSYGLNFKGHGTQASFFDYDNDGDLDCYLLNHAVTYTDGYKDISARNIADTLSGDQLLQNNNGKFINVTTSAGIYCSSIGYGLGIATGDINNDGWMDIYVSNDFKENDYCYMNNGDGTFTEKCKTMFSYNSRFSMGNDLADNNNDGWLDLISLDMLASDEKVLKSSVADDDMGIYNYKHNFGFHYQFSKNCLQQNLNGQYFQELGLQKGVAATDWSWAPLFADFNNDGNKDLFISNGFKYRVNDLDFNSFFQGTLISNRQQNIITDKRALIKKLPGGKVPDYLLLQDADQQFTDMSAQAGFTTPTLSNGAAYADLDHDGRLDLIINRLEEPAGIYRNMMPEKNYLNISFKGIGGNTSGIGSSINIYTKNGYQFYQQSLSRGFMSSVSPVLHIGLGDSKRIDSLIVSWPDGSCEKLYNINPNKTIELLQKNAHHNFQKPSLKISVDTSWKNITGSSGLTFSHQEDAFDDLDVQPFLPHSLSSQGPKTTVGDINNDGLQDFFTCGAKGQSGQLFLQTTADNFITSSQQALSADSMYEETDALFFDADGDQDKDLYVVSGGNEFFGSDTLLKDRLYLNDGKGNFSLSNGLPALYENKSCVAACDFDKDGDTDLFVGGRANARMYGYLPASVLLQNDGKGNFTEVTIQFSAGLQFVGMVTAACWSDIDRDGWQDLVIAGEWMLITIFKNEKGKLVRTDQPGLKQTNGWWTTIFKADLDNDGDDDFLLGNWGTNSKLTATTAKPLTMYLADWDNNGETEPLLCVYKNDTCYNFLGKSDLEKRLPYLKKKYLRYADIAGKSVNELFGKTAISNAKKSMAYTLQSSIAWNDEGRLSLQPLPSFLQAAPIFSFAAIDNGLAEKNYIAAGNFYDVLPFEGRYDAMLPTIFAIHSKQVQRRGVVIDKGAVRSLQPIVLSTKKTALLIAKNNAPLSLISK